MQSNSPPPKFDVNPEQVPSIKPTEDTSSQSDNGRRGALSSAPQSTSSAENSKVDTQPEKIQNTTPTESDSIGIASPSPDMGMLHGKGVLNGGTTGEKAIFAGDKIATPSDGFANITLLGSAVLLQPQSLVTFNGNSVELERGGVGITTSTGMTVHFDDMTVSPAAPGTAKFEVVDNEDTVQVAAYQGSVLLSQEGDTTVLSQGQQTTKEKKNKKKAMGAVPGSSGAVSKKTAFILLGAAGSTAAVLAILKENSERSTPISPSKP
jgi:hypothetical protein